MSFERSLTMEVNLRDALMRHNIPKYMHDGVIRYVMKGIAPGGFMIAVLENNLFEAVNRADIENSLVLKEWVLFIYNQLPSSCWGSVNSVVEWQKRGGWEGIYGNESSIS